MKLKIFIYLVVPIALLALFLRLSYRFITTESETTFSILEAKHYDLPVIDLLVDNTVTGEFIAQHQNLGQVAVRFDNNFRINNDQLTFRFKEKGTTEWYYQNKYKTDQFQPHKLFPFGFPLIKNAKGNTYIFELESVSGSDDDFVSISGVKPPYTSRYEFTRDHIFASIGNTLYFFTQKLQNYLTNFVLVATIFVYSLPFLLYALLLVVEHRFFATLTKESLVIALKNNIRIPIYLTSLGYLADILFVHYPNDLLLVIPLGIWCFVIFLTNCSPKISLILGITNMFIAVLLLLAHNPIAAEKASAWAYSFVTIGLIQVFIYQFRKDEIH